MVLPCFVYICWLVCVAVCTYVYASLCVCCVCTYVHVYVCVHVYKGVHVVCVLVVRCLCLCVHVYVRRYHVHSKNSSILNYTQLLQLSVEEDQRT